MPVVLRSAAFAADHATAAAGFWARLLDRPVVDEAHGVLVPGDDTQLGLRFVPRPAPRTGPDRMHLHVTSASPEHQQATVAMALELGARHLDVGQRPEEEHVVLADPAGNAFCVIEPGNAYLAGCGPLGELACEGSRAVGVFWSAALRLAAGVGPGRGDGGAVPARRDEGRLGRPARPAGRPGGGPALRLVVVDGGAAAEVDRLVALGATLRDRGGKGVVRLADPDGVEFRLHTG